MLLPCTKIALYLSEVIWPELKKVPIVAWLFKDLTPKRKAASLPCMVP
ncbi:hypothetical protein LNU06_02420 [Campylobacter sp. VicNov18]|nr:hypothetical protein [Campylobacter bilis]MBM0637005.1 hypothetical protein [Campylobacter bilis]MCC8277840.1 hypothetical protein [Campylobacter bilis]MCC8299450.1 hypothetical protein [Campylobacter bilis]MCC8300750.1 hypothetical protein [Campylobacter bilis]MCC8349652.1 hypothetical protein [Campylobacter bilis]